MDLPPGCCARCAHNQTWPQEAGTDIKSSEKASKLTSMLRSQQRAHHRHRQPPAPRVGTRRGALGNGREAGGTQHFRRGRSPVPGRAVKQRRSVGPSKCVGKTDAAWPGGRAQGGWGPRSGRPRRAPHQQKCVVTPACCQREAPPRENIEARQGTASANMRRGPPAPGPPNQPAEFPPDPGAACPTNQTIHKHMYTRHKAGKAGPAKRERLRSVEGENGTPSPRSTLLLT